MATAEGVKIVWGRCWEAGGAPAYWPSIQVFRSLELDRDPFGVAPDLGGTPYLNAVIKTGTYCSYNPV